MFLRSDTAHGLRGDTSLEEERTRVLVRDESTCVLVLDEDLELVLENAEGRRVRGAALRAFVSWYEVELGTPRFRALLERAPLAVLDTLDTQAEGLGLIADLFYPMSVVAPLLDALTGHLSEVRRARVALRAARTVMRSTLAGEQRLLFSEMMIEARYALDAQRLWSAYYDSGELMVRQRSDIAGALASVKNWHGHHPFLCELNAGASTAIYEALGKKHVHTMRISCVEHGYRECRFATTWDR